MDSLHRKWSSDQNYRTAYEEMVPEFDLARSIISSRTDAGLTQAQLAERMNTTQSVIARLEAGRTYPSIKTLARVAQATGTRLKIRASSRNRTTRSDLRPVGRLPQRRGSCGCRCTELAASVLFRLPGCSPGCRGRALPPFKRWLLGQFIGAGGHDFIVRQADVNAGSQHGDLSIAQSNLHPGLRSRTRHRASATVRRHWRPPNRRHESTRNGVLHRHKR